MLVRLCRARGGFEPDIRHRADDIRLLIQLAAAGLAVALVPALGRPEAETGVVVRELHESGTTRRIFAAVRAGSAGHPSIAAVLDGLREQVDDLELG
jgi:DNA-binding transcriptional LysR family regulator